MTKEKKHKRIIILLCGVISLLAVLFCMYLFTSQNNNIRPVNGVLDLKHWSAQSDGRITLNGEWEFYWHKLISYQQPTDGGITVKVPSVWNIYQGTGKSGSGFGTYVLKVKNAKPGIPVALFIPSLSSSYELYINDRLLSSSGKVGTQKESSMPWLKPDVVEFTPQDTGYTIIIRVANYIYNCGGMRFAISMGTPVQMRSMAKFNADKDLFLFGALFVMGFYYFTIFLLRRDDRSSLFFVVMCLIFACRVTVLGDFLIYRIVPGVSYHAIVILDYLTTFWFSISAVFMVKQLFPKVFSNLVLNIFLAYGLIMTAVVLFSPVAFFSGLVVPIQIIAIVMGVYGSCCVLVAYLRGDNDAGLIFVGGVALAFAALHDVLYDDLLILSSIGEWVAIAQFLMVLLQAFILARRFSEAFKSVNILSQKLLRLDKIKDEFLANTSHELRTPLNGILGISEAMLRGSKGELSGPQKEELTAIAGSSRRLANLVNDILDYAKMKNGDIYLNIVPIRIEGLINSVINIFRQISTAKAYKIITEIPVGLPPVIADENRVAQILFNLVGNAAKFTIEGYIKISALKRGDMLEICVSDTGEGIPGDKLEDIFKSFEQVDSSLTRRHGGTGLGLSITKNLVELQGGRIWVESVPGQGSSFYFTLPLSSEVPESNITGPDLSAYLETAAVIQPNGIINEKGNPPILLVDDDTISLQASVAILLTDGYAITAVNSGKAALEALEGCPWFSAVILDVMMPEMSGYEVCRKIRENKSVFDLPVLMLTARTSTQDIVMGFEAGANDYLPKPFEPEELLARVRTLTMLKASADKAMTAEIGFLQAQIKPHFLFNALNTVASFCSTDPPYARKLITGFANYLRQSFDFESLDTFIPLEREIELVNSYVDIEKARFGEKLTVVFDVESATKAEVFPLSIQPLVENAIRHGLRKKTGVGTVTVSVRQADGKLMVWVSDDGCGIAPDKLKVILSPEGKQGVGLWNIDRRLRKLFGCGLKIESELGKGTTVSFTIPSRGRSDDQGDCC
ncbi:MAG: ATP-binding protein [Bacillota bacterium]|nr:ATP-binding protein [Bacillota bacterium]